MWNMISGLVHCITCTIWYTFQTRNRVRFSP